jgi:endo-1,4-beta-xylanase
MIDPSLASVGLGAVVAASAVLACTTGGSGGVPTSSEPPAAPSQAPAGPGEPAVATPSGLATAVQAVRSAAPALQSPSREPPSSTDATDFLAPSALPARRELPDPFAFHAGGRVTTRADWPRRRHELSRAIQHYEYGPSPPAPAAVQATRRDATPAAPLALQVTVTGETRSVSFPISVSLPEGPGPFPAFVSAGNLEREHERFTRRGYAVVDVALSEVAADSPGRTGAFYTLYPDSPAGVLMAWAWGFQRVVDALSSLRELRVDRLAVTGHSRYGKAALVAGALDERIALTVPASSGLGGTGNYRFFYEDAGRNERIENIVGRFPYWFSPRLVEFVGQPERLPFDQHSLMALVAPRGLLITMGEEDHWANPRGTQSSFRAARRVYDFLDAGQNIGIAYRPGGHSMVSEDFDAMIDFADRLYAAGASRRVFDRLPYPDEPAAMRW